MLKAIMGNVLAVLVSLSMTGCSIYDRYGYGRVVSSKLDESSATAVDLPSNAPSISQRFLPQGASAKGEHKGFDVLVPSGTPVLAAANGEVSRVQTSFLYGRQVMIDHGTTAAGYRIQTRYFHLSEQQVAVGDRLQRGQVIGYSGLSGMAGGFPHLHFEVHRLGEDAVALSFLDPQLFWVDGKGKITCYDRHRAWSVDPLKLSYPVPCLGVDWQ